MNETPLSSTPESAAYRPQRTPLQAWLMSAFDVVLDARNELGEDEFRAFIEVTLERLALEAARLAVGEALKARRSAA